MPLETTAGYMSLDKAAAELAVTEVAVKRLIARERLAAVQLGAGGPWRVSATVLGQYIGNGGPDLKMPHIVAGWFEAVKFAAENPKEADAIMAKFTGQKPEEFTKEKTGVRFYGEKENKDYFGTAKNPGLLYKVTQRAADVWFDLKFIKAKPKAADLIDGSFL